MATALIDPGVRDRIIVKTAYSERDLIIQVPGSRYASHDGGEKSWSVPLTWPACLQLRGIFGQALKLDESLVRWATERRDHVTRVATLRGLTTPDVEDVDPRLYPFQRAGVRFLEAAGNALLADEMGTGKTIQALTALRRAPDPLPALVICPNTTKANWEREARTWFPEARPYVITGGLAQRRKLLSAAAQDPSALIIINIEGVRGHSRLAPYGSIRLKRCVTCSGGDVTALTEARCEVHPKELNRMTLRTVIFDEAHRIKDPKSLQTRAAWAVGHQPEVLRRWALTGTPIANHPGDLWSIMHFVEPTEFPVATKFIDRYCQQAWNAFGGLSVIGVRPEVRTEFDAIMDTRMRRMPKALVLPQLPSKIRTTIRVEMTPKQRAAYVELGESLITRLDDGELLVAMSDLAAQVRLLQLAAAYCTIEEDGSVRLTEPSPKIDALVDLIADTGDKPVVVAAEHRQLIDLAAARLKKVGISYGLVTGKQDEWERKQALLDLEEGRIKVLLFTIKAGGTGLNMTRADAIIFLQRSWSMIDNVQAEDRVHRIGAEVHDGINVIDIVTDDTIEVNVHRRIAEKFQRLDEITRDRAVLLAAGLSTDEHDRWIDNLLTSHLGSPA